MEPGNFKEEIVSSRDVSKRTIFSFLIFFVLMGIGVFGWKWINRQPENNGVPRPIRSVLNANEMIFSNFIFSRNNLSKTFPVSSVAPGTRVNGDAGMSEGFDPGSWKLDVVKNPGDTMHISLDQIKALPKTEVVFDFKCIEGWSQVTHWGGVKFSDFLKYFHLDEQAAMKYVGLVTPDKGYYVGIDFQSILQPQTILCYEMNNQPLPMDQGAPLRLIIPVKYGIKHLKRIGTIFFSNYRPADYWYERGYDYYAGL